MNRRHKDFQSSALPTELPSQSCKYAEMRLLSACAVARLSYFCKKQYKEKPMKPNANRFQKVFDNRNRRMRGLWQRNGAFYAQIRLTRGQPATRILLHNTSTVPQALTAMQALKKSRRDGELKIQKQRGIPTFSERLEPDRSRNFYFYLVPFNLRPV